jgi:phage I-like protein
MLKTPLAELRRRCKATAAAVPAGESRMMLRGSWSRGDAAEAPPDRFKVLPWGETKTRDGKLVVNEEAAQVMESRMKASRRDVVRIDREHATAFVPALKRNPRDILGYGKLEVVPGEGVFLSSVRWTPEGKEVWAALPDVSPSFNFRKADNLVTNLESVALCCDGEIEGLTLLSADGDAGGIYLEPTEDSMKELLLQLLTKAGVEVPEGATDADIQALAMKHLEGGKPADKKDDETAAAMSAQEARLKKLEDAEAARQLSADNAAREELKRQASAEGKVIPLTDEQIAETEVKTLSAIVAGLPAGQVPLGEGKSGKPAGEGTKAGEKSVTLTAAEKQMCELYSLTEEDFKKYAA